MLTRYQQATNAFNHNALAPSHAAPANRLTLSYDANNYQPLLSHLQQSEDPRWILFIAPPGKPNFTYLQQAGIDKSRIITLSAKQVQDAGQLFKDALASNNYAAIIHWTAHCDQSLVDEIAQLSAQTQTHSFVYCAQ